jgi:trans-aconitate methyltransferase
MSRSAPGKPHAAISTTKKFYNRYAKDWTSRKTDSFHHEKQFRKILTLWPTKGAIIDMGCAGGIHVPLFLGVGRHLRYCGLDISSSFLKIARSRYPQLEFLEGNIADAASLPKKKQDGFWAASTLMHVPLEAWDDMFDAIEQLCKPGSYGYFSIPTEHPSAQKNDADVRHFTCLSPQEQRAFLKRRNWKIEAKGIIDGFTKESVWRWYIIKLPD